MVIILPPRRGIPTRRDNAKVTIESLLGLYKTAHLYAKILFIFLPRCISQRRACASRVSISGCNNPLTPRVPRAHYVKASDSFASRRTVAPFFELSMESPVGK
jgi:hypothetical protein